MMLDTGVVIRQLTADDVPACADLAASRGWPREERKWRFLLGVGRGYGAMDAGGRLVGSVLLTRCTPRVAAIGSLLVAEPLQGRGIGRALMGCALREAGVMQVTLASTRQGRPLYDRLGFREVGRLDMYRGAFGPPSGPAARMPLSRPVTAADLPRIAAFDAQVHGGDRSPLLTAALDFVLEARMVEDGDRLLAVGAVWDSEGTARVGPLIAVDEEAALAVLIDLAGTHPGPGKVDLRVDRCADLHAGRSRIRGWLDRQGFELHACTAVMVHGPRQLPGRPELLWSPLMQALT
jgi:predicted N-acetyltransferase YhbS